MKRSGIGGSICMTWLLAGICVFMPARAESSTAQAASTPTATVKGVTTEPAAVTKAPTQAPAPTQTPAPALAMTGPAACAVADKATPPSSCGRNADPLMLDSMAQRLPNALLGKAYQHQFAAQGGLPPYHFKLGEGDLPKGLVLSPAGGLQGLSINVGTSTFRVQVSDQSGQSVSQRYVLRVVAPMKPSKAKPVPAVEPAEPAPPPAISMLTIKEAQTPLPAKTPIDVYLLTAETLKLIKPADGGKDGTAEADKPDVGKADVDKPAESKAAAKDETSVPDELSDEGLAQLKELLLPLVGVEYPNQALFAAALDAQTCRYASELLRKTAVEHHQELSKADAMAKVCPATTTQGAGLNTPVKTNTEIGSTDPVPLADLPSTLMPTAWRSWLIHQAKQSQSLDGVAAPELKERGCNCLTGDTVGKVYGFYPKWHLPTQNETLDFSLYERLTLFAQPIDEDGNVTPLPLDNAEQLKFLRKVRAHGGKLDIALYRNNWQFLRGMPEDHQDRIVAQIAAQSVRMINTPLPGFESRWHGWLPFFASKEYVADGLTLYLDMPPTGDKSLLSAFLRFRDKLILAVIREMKKVQRPLTLNLMVNDVDLLPSANATNGGSAADGGRAKWTIDKLFDYLIQAEEPHIVNGRIDSPTGNYTSRSGVSVYYVITLSEPTGISKKQLNHEVEISSVLAGGDRRIFLRKIIPMLSVGSDVPQQLKDNMSYFVDDFGGIALWPKPIKQSDLSALVIHGLRTTFLINQPDGDGICALVCEWRWPLRLAFVLLVLVGVVSFALYFGLCRIRALGRPYQLYLVLGCIPTGLIGGLLLDCDPNLAAVREGNTLLFVLSGVLLLAALFPLLKPRVERP